MRNTQTGRNGLPPPPYVLLFLPLPSMSFWKRRGETAPGLGSSPWAVPPRRCPGAPACGGVGISRPAGAGRQRRVRVPWPLWQALPSAVQGTDGPALDGSRGPLPLVRNQKPCCDLERPPHTAQSGLPLKLFFGELCRMSEPSHSHEYTPLTRRKLKEASYRDCDVANIPKTRGEYFLRELYFNAHF